MNIRGVTEFIIVPPYEKTAEVIRTKDRLTDFLSRKFPGYDFKVTDFAPVGNYEDFHVLPLMNFIDLEGNSRMCEPPQNWLLSEIGNACHDFLSVDIKLVNH